MFDIHLTLSAPSSDIHDAADAALWLTTLLAGRDADKVEIITMTTERTDA